MSRETLNELRNGAAGPASARLPAPALLNDIADEDWDDLLTAVKTRLRQTVGERSAAAGNLLQGPMGRIQSSVLDCVSALDQLHNALRHERAQRQQLEAEVVQAQTALDDVRAELVLAHA